jgi:hypothetical protein
LERKLDGKAEVIRLNTMSGVGRQAAMVFGVRAVPTLIVVDGDGQLTLTQVGIIRPGEVQAQVDALNSN